MRLGGVGGEDESRRDRSAGEDPENAGSALDGPLVGGPPVPDIRLHVEADDNVRRSGGHGTPRQKNRC